MLREGANVDVGHDLGTSHININFDTSRSSSPRLKRANSVGRLSQHPKSSFVKKLGFGIFSSKLLGIRPNKPSSTDNVQDKDPYRGSRSLDMTLIAQKPYMSSPLLALPDYTKAMRKSVDEDATGSGSSSFEGNDETSRATINAFAAHVQGLQPFSVKVADRTDVAKVDLGDESANIIPLETPTRPAIPRLNSLPPLTPLSPLPSAFIMSPSKRPGDETQERARLSPSVVVRAPPFPILSLPPVTPLAGPSSAKATSPPATFGPSARGRSFTLDFMPSVSATPAFQTMPQRPRARLNTMPMLPREGQDVRPDGDEESDQEAEAYLDEEEEDGEETEMDDRRLGARTPDSELDEDEDDDHDHDVEQTPTGKGKGKEKSGRRPFAAPRMPSISSLISSMPTPGLPRKNSLGLSSFLAAAGVGKGGVSTSTASASASATGPGPAGSVAGLPLAEPSDGRGLGTGLPRTTSAGRTATSELSSSSADVAAPAAATQRRNGDGNETPNYNDSQGRQALYQTYHSDNLNTNTRPPTLSVHQSTTSSSGSSDSAQSRDYFSLSIPSTFTSSSSSAESSSSSTTFSQSTGQTSEDEWEPHTPTVQDYKLPSHANTQEQKTASINSQAVPTTHPSSAGAQKAITSGINKKSAYIEQVAVRDPLLTPRPGLYHQASKSMVDLLSMKSPRLSSMLDDEQVSEYLHRSSRGARGDGKEERTGVGKEGIFGADAGAGALTRRTSNDGRAGVAASPSNINLVSESAAPARVRDGPSSLNSSPKGISDIAPLPGTSAPALSVLSAVSPPPQAEATAEKMSVRPTTTTTLRRRRSMPTFTASGPPPPYPSFLLPEQRRFVPVPREEEGREALPPYTNDIKLMAIMPRKMEFGSPGMPAKDRKWRRVQVMLEGTVLRVYECPSKLSGVNPISGWWEKKVGVGDIALPSSATSAQNGVVVIGARRERRPVKWEEELRAEEERRSSMDTASTAHSTAESDAQTSTAEESDARTEPQPHRSKKHNLASALLHPHFSRSRQTLHPSANASALGHSRARSVSPAPSQMHSRENSATRSSLQITRGASDESRRASSMDLSARPSSRSMSRMSEVTPSASASSVSVNSSNTPPSSHSHSSSLVHPFRSHHHHHRNRDQTHASSTESVVGGKESLPEPNRKDLIREYSMQRAESGLASDYFKRKNVLRVRLEGEQFLLQAHDVPGVIEWIEGLQAAANIALDLDDRPMPKGPIFPRRRRRRRVVVQTDAEAAAAAVSGSTVTNAAASS